MNALLKVAHRNIITKTPLRTIKTLYNNGKPTKCLFMGQVVPLKRCRSGVPGVYDDPFISTEDAYYGFYVFFAPDNTTDCADECYALAYSITTNAILVLGQRENSVEQCLAVATDNLCD